MIAMGAGFALGGAACAVFGYWLNVLRPRQKAEEYLQGLRQDLWQRMREGTFQVPAGAPAHSEPAGAPAPRDEAEASQQIERIVAQQSPEVRRRLRNRNTLFFIPLQWLGSMVVIGSIVLMILGRPAGVCDVLTRACGRQRAGLGLALLSTSPPLPKRSAFPRFLPGVMTVFIQVRPVICMSPPDGSGREGWGTR